MVEIPEAKIGQYYGEFMEDIKWRSNAVRAALREIIAEQGTDREAYAFRYLRAEFCYLQIRRITELVALALVVAHNSRERIRSNVFVDNWRTDKIFHELEKLGDAALPKPARPAVSPLSFRDLKQINRSCSDKLHSIALKGYLTKGNKRVDARQILGWITRITEILDPHTLILPGPRLIAACLNDENGAVRCQYFYPQHPPQ